MRGGEFRGLAEAVTRAYGDDPWFFLRELAQNSRDAGARAVRVSAWIDAAGMETIHFEDDGRGMTLDHARRFLFRLYASDKGGDRAAAGRYGIGFWTVLRFAPARIVLQSRRGRRGWAVSLDAELNAGHGECRLSRPGTAVTLQRPGRGCAEAEFQRQVRAGLLAYCRYLRRNDRRGSPLPLWFMGANLTEPMILPGPLSFSFRSGPVEGAVALGPEPEVRLYARGLPVWRGTLLGQMSHLHADDAAAADVGAGLAPVFLLNGNHLDVTFSRDLALENRDLDLVRRKAEAALQRLLLAALERSFPRTAAQRLGDRLRKAVRPLSRHARRWLPPLLLAPLLLFLLRLGPLAPRRQAPSWPGPGLRSLSYRGAVVNEAPSLAPASFSYSPPLPALFRLFVAAAYDRGSGFVRGPVREETPPPPLSCPDASGMEIRLRAATGELFLPLPTGWGLAPGTLRLDGGTPVTARTTALGETVARLPGGGLLSCRLCPEAAITRLPARQEALYLDFPEFLSLPADLEATAVAARPLAPAEKALLARRLSRTRLDYDDSPAVAERYRGRGGRGDWLAMVLEIGAGDCDVINGLQVLLLRRMGVASRLTVGLVGENGQARPRLHAWCEYFDRGWKVSDAAIAGSGAALPARPAPAPLPEPVAGPSAAAVALALAALTALGVFALLWKRPAKPGLAAVAGEKTALLLAQAAGQAILSPGLWGTDSPLRRHPLVPLAGGGWISILQAQGLLRRKRLLFTANRNPLALSLAAGGAAVVDLSLPAAAPLAALFADAVDSDRLCRLRPTAADPLLAAANRLISPRRGMFFWLRGPDRPFLLAPGLEERDLLGIDLPVALKRPPFFFPRRFVAVAPGGVAYAEAAARFAASPALAVMRFLGRAAAEKLVGPALLRRVARRQLRSGT